MDTNLSIKVARIHKLNSDSKVKAFVDIKINDSILIKGLSVVDGQKGLFVSMPREKANDGKWYDSIRAMTKEAKAEIQAAVLEAYGQPNP